MGGIACDAICLCVGCAARKGERLMYRPSLRDTSLASGIQPTFVDWGAKCEHVQAKVMRRCSAIMCRELESWHLG